ncbi:MAG: FMN-binding protein [Coriobacteriales bacterium]|jgi:uncharacterized protein with FMN-binding domain|nr:FMN-binding protein [Coriobacteriales bacterium]
MKPALTEQTAPVASSQPQAAAVSVVKTRSYANLVRLILLLTGLILFAWNAVAAAEAADYQAVIEANIDGVVSVERQVGTQPQFTIHTTSGDFYAVCDSAVGYQSRIEMMTVSDSQGQLHGVYVVSHGETPVFFERLYEQGYFRQYQDLTVAEPIYLGNASGFIGFVGDAQTDNVVDAVSGSTVSSHAAAAAVSKAAQTLAVQHLSVNWANPYDGFTFSPIDAALLLVIVGAVLLAKVSILRRVRPWWLLVVVVVMGFYVQSFLSLSNIYAVITLQIPKLTNLRWYLLMVASFGLILVLGKNLYCASVCPFGALQELLNQVARFRQLRPSRRLATAGRLATLCRRCSRSRAQPCSNAAIRGHSNDRFLEVP